MPRGSWRARRGAAHGRQRHSQRFRAVLFSKLAFRRHPWPFRLRGSAGERPATRTPSALGAPGPDALRHQLGGGRWCLGSLSRRDDIRSNAGCRTACAGSTALPNSRLSCSTTSRSPASRGRRTGEGDGEKSPVARWWFCFVSAGSVRRRSPPNPRPCRACCVRSVGRSCARGQGVEECGASMGVVDRHDEGAPGGARDLQCGTGPQDDAGPPGSAGS